jgi:hypothetical protein
MSVSRTLALATTALMSAVAAGISPGWTNAPPVPAPAGATDSALRDVSVLSPTDVWAVGSWWSAASHPLVVHWDGTAWSGRPVPVEDYTPAAVDAVTATDVWTVGSRESQPTGLALHYDGVTWAAAPVLAASPSSLADVDMRTATDGWAVGASAAQPLILRWTVDHFTAVPAPKLGVAGRLTSVFAGAVDDAWAVGSVQSPTGRQEALVLHWDGVAWSRQAVPTAGSVDETLQSVAATGSGEVWAVGSTCALSCAPRALHLSRGVWQAVPTGVAATVYEVVPLAPSDVWIFGQTAAGLDHIEHWDGTRFTTEGGLPPATGNGQPASAIALAAAATDKATGALWAVGWTGTSPRRTPHVIYRG